MYLERHKFYANDRRAAWGDLREGNASEPGRKPGENEREVPPMPRSKQTFIQQ